MADVFRPITTADVVVKIDYEANLVIKTAAIFMTAAIPLLQEEAIERAFKLVHAVVEKQRKMIDDRIIAEMKRRRGY